MGDMKTPDFDDLLAAFDIPDATSLDAKEAIQESQDEAEGHLKHAEMCIDATVSVPHPMITLDAPAVSVIVKNTNRQETYEPLMARESAHLLQNGFRTSASCLETHLVSHSNYAMLDTSSLNEDCSGGFLEKIPVTQKVSSLSKSLPEFSPVSSPESEVIQRNGVNDHPEHRELYFPHDSLFVSADVSMSDNYGKPQTCNMIDKCHKEEPSSRVNNSNTHVMSLKAGCSESCKKQEVEKTSSDPLATDDYIDDDDDDNDGTSAYPASESNLFSLHPCVKTQTSKLSSSCDELMALNAQKDPSELRNPRNLPVVCKDTMKVSPKVPISPRSPRSPCEIVKQLIKQPDSPMSTCSDISEKASPALVTGSPPAIPRVRIKTIKTSSGQIKRTVTSILPDSETEDFQSPFGSSPSQSSVEETISKMLSVCPSPDFASELIFENGKEDSSKTPLLVCTSASNEAVMKLKKPQFQNISPGLKKNPRACKQKVVSPAQAGCPTKPNYLPKALHLANLNLVPHSVAASVTARVSTNRQDCSQLSSSKVCSSVPLVHQVKKTSAKTRAIIPNTAAGTLNRLLNYSNPVPTYVPNLSPPPDSDIKLPAQGHCCLECGDSFGLEKSLAFHYTRRSVHIEVTCTLCSKTLVFFNRCALLAHARDHKNKGMMMQCSQLFMKPIAVDQMLVPTKRDRATSQMCEGRSTLSLTKSQAVMPLYSDKITQHGLKCIECNKQMPDCAALVGHHQRSSIKSEELICKICNMLLPNKCSYRAHQRIHTHKAPYSCPECGAVTRFVDFQKHVMENCLHYARSVGYLCCHCDVAFISLPLLKRHIDEKHCEIFYKCTICPVAFKSSDGCHMHVKTKHAGSGPSHQLIHKCSCESVFKKKQLLYQHLRQNTCIFNCPECTSFFTQKLALVQHFKEIHGGIFKGEKEKGLKLKAEIMLHPSSITSTNQQSKLTKSDGGVSKEVKRCSASEQSSRGQNKKNTGWTCGECLLWVPDRETYVGHLRISHGKSVKRNPCRLCDRSFNSSASLRRHIRSDHDGKKKVYTCWYCTNDKITFTQHSMLKNHLSLMHGIKNPDFSLLAKSASLETSKGKGPKRTAENDPCNGGITEFPPDKRLRPLFRCAKCGHTTDDFEQFQKHIPQHKTDADMPQCQHCGLCFTSQLALGRHLHIVHKVKESEEADKEFSDPQGANNQVVDVSTNVSVKNLELEPLSPKQTVLCMEEEISKCWTETCTKALVPESLDRSLLSGSDKFQDKVEFL